MPHTKPQSNASFFISWKSVVACWIVNSLNMIVDLCTAPFVVSIRCNVGWDFDHSDGFPELAEFMEKLLPKADIRDWAVGAFPTAYLPSFCRTTHSWYYI